MNPALYFCKRLLILLLVFAGTCISSAAGSNVESIFDSVLPVPGWKPEGKPYRYIPQNLFEYIDGAADFFIAYGFVGLTGANYSPVSGESDAVTIDIYDMGNKLNAFGVFQSRRDSQAPSLNIAAASVGTDDYIAFVKDRFYVEIQGYITTKKENGVLKNMASRVAEHLPGDTSLPVELSYLPEKKRIPGSLRYIRGGILGYAFLDTGIVGDYQVKGEKMSVFIAFLSSYEDAVKAVEQHRHFLQKSGEKCLPLEGFGKHSFVSKEPFHQKIMVAQEGKFVAGVYDLSTAEAGKALLADTLKNIKQAPSN
ncbi:MAG: DUF6599 family protein [Desulfobacterales bacterium]